MYPTISPTIPSVTPAPKQPTGAITPITQQQASPITGQSIPTVGTSEYNKAQTATPTQSKVPLGWDAQTYANFKAANPTLEPDAEDTYLMQNAGKPTQSDLLNKQLSDINKQYQDVSTGYQDALKKANETLEGIRTGSVPLSGYEQAQLDATRQAMQQVINSQALENKNYESGIKIANEARGLSRYSPEMAQGEIFAAVSEGNKKIADLNSKMVLTLSDMERGFRDNNFNKVKEAFQFIKEAKDEKTATLDNMYKTVVSKQKALEEDRQAQAMADVSSLLLDDSYTLSSKKKYISQLVASGALNQEQIKEINSSLKDATDLQMKNDAGFQDIIKTISMDKTLTTQQKKEAINKVNNIMETGGSLNEAYFASSDYMSPIGVTGNELLTIDEAKVLQVPYGTTRNEAIKMKRVPGMNVSVIDPITGQPVNPDVAKGNAADYQTISSAYSRLNGTLSSTGKTAKEIVDLAKQKGGYSKAKKLVDSLSSQEAEALAREALRIQTPDVAKAGGDAQASLRQSSELAWGARWLLSQVGLMNQYDPDQVLKLLMTVQNIKEDADKSIKPGALGAENITYAPDGEIIEIID